MKRPISVSKIGEISHLRGKKGPNFYLSFLSKSNQKLHFRREYGPGYWYVMGHMGHSSCFSLLPPIASSDLSVTSQHWYSAHHGANSVRILSLSVWFLDSGYFLQLPTPLGPPGRGRTLLILTTKLILVVGEKSRKYHLFCLTNFYRGESMFRPLQKTVTQQFFISIPSSSLSPPLTMSCRIQLSSSLVVQR